MTRNLAYGILIAVSAFCSGYFCSLGSHKHLSTKGPFHCDVSFADGCKSDSDSGCDYRVCFDRTDGHGNKVPFTRKDKEVVNMFGVR